jgi:hypothetical protein
MQAAIRIRRAEEDDALELSMHGSECGSEIKEPWPSTENGGSKSSGNTFSKSAKIPNAT